MSFPYKLVAFDLDGTLAESKQSITPEMAQLLTHLANVSKVTVISGGSLERFQAQILGVLPPHPNLILLPAEGSERFEYDTKQKKWQSTDKQRFPAELKKKVITTLEEIIADPKFEIPPYPQGEYIEDRDTEIAFSGLGQNAPLSEKEKWDPDRTRRMKIKKAIEARVSGVMVAVAGTTSIDILPKGFDKARGIELLVKDLGIKPEEVLFVGDAVVPGGNDYSVFAAGIETIRVNGPEDTAEAIRELLGESKHSLQNVMHAFPVFPQNPIAYFCSEFALDADPLQYAGGLGILAGDYVLQAADENIPFVALGLRYGEVVPHGFSLLASDEGPIEVVIPIEKERVRARVWHREMASNVHVILLSTDFEGNPELHRNFTRHLYDTDFFTRIKQQMVLGIGGVKTLARLNITPRIYHLNEGHTAFAGAAIVLEKPEELDKVVASKHTILSAAGLLITKEDLKKVLGAYAKECGSTSSVVFKKGIYDLDSNVFSTTKLIISLAVRKNAVSKIHAVFEKDVHPQSTLISITNGVHRKRWQAPEFFARTKATSDEKLRQIKRKLRNELFSYIENTSGKKFNPDICTLVWARRFASYKRPLVLFTDIERLTQILTNTNRPLQCVISGKAHPDDKEGQEAVQKILEFSESSAAKGRVVYLPDYSIESAEKLVKGADIWLNTPIRGKEACGTSGMKAGLNGALQVSVSDGWVDEVSLQGIGWPLPTDDPARVLYDLLEHEILPEYYGESGEGMSEKWMHKVRGTIELVEKNYTADRMLRDYEEKLYS